MPALMRWHVARVVIELDVEQALGDRPVGEVVDALEALPPPADELAGVEELFGGDLGLGPVPPWAALLRAAELTGRERTF